jgi:hypothetical protein
MQQSRCAVFALVGRHRCSFVRHPALLAKPHHTTTGLVQKENRAHSVQVGIINNLTSHVQNLWEITASPLLLNKKHNTSRSQKLSHIGEMLVARPCSPITPRGTPNTMPCPIRRTEHATSFYFFFPLPFALVADPFDATLLARDVDADAGEALPLTASSCLFYNILASVTAHRYSLQYEP